VCSGVGPYTCEFCGKVHTLLSRFRKHINAHSAEKPYVCSVCSKSFDQKSILTSHMLVHTGKKLENYHLQLKVIKILICICTREKDHLHVTCLQSFIWKMQLVAHLRKYAK
jgi:hypothetical protein